jgi:DNA-binding HxlR family transcriptional regulator
MAFDPDERRSHCPISCSLDLIDDRWTLLVIRDMLIARKPYFTEFLSSAGLRLVAD